MRREESTFDFEGKLEAETAKAYLVDFTVTGEQAWLPKSQVKKVEESDAVGMKVFTITEWIAKQKGLL